MVHSGMNASALYLFDRLYSLAQVSIIRSLTLPHLITLHNLAHS